MAATRTSCLIVGLGNPGPEYHRTRHNIGFEVLDRVAIRIGGGTQRRVQRSELIEGRFAGCDVLCLKPGLYMNRSGAPIAAVITEFEIEPARVLVVFDDVDLPPGKLRLRASGSSGGHRGAEDLIRFIGSGFARLRVGIGRPDPQHPMERYVLEPFGVDELPVVERAMERAVDAVCLWIRQGIEEAMRQFNTSTEDEPRSEAESRKNEPN